VLAGLEEPVVGSDRSARVRVPRCRPCTAR
jgi:hypothetical protein